MGNSIIVAIHQPNFLPWLGFFDKLVKSDVFLLMDTAQIPKKKPSFTNRTKILIERKESWCPTIEIFRNHSGVIPIKEAKIVDNSNCKRKIVKTIQFYYSKSAYFGSVFPVFEEIILNENNNLSEYNIHAILTLLNYLKIDKYKLITTSDLGFSLSKEDLSVLVTKMIDKVDGSTYLCGNGAMGYMDAETFSKAGISLMFQNYVHPIYQQFNTEVFIPGLSILDPLMNLGFAQVSKLLKEP